MDRRLIVVKTCNECPHIHKSSGMGHCASFIRCDKFGIMLFDWDGEENFDYQNKIHPKCGLERYE